MKWWGSIWARQLDDVATALIGAIIMTYYIHSDVKKVPDFNEVYTEIDTYMAALWVMFSALFAVALCAVKICRLIFN
jgi:hypothetical protein